MEFWQAILLGALQGVTEFLPISSSGHLVIAQSLLEGFHQPGVTFDVLLHVATMVAVVCYFRREVAALLASPFRSDAEALLQRRLLGLIVLGTLPVGVVGLLFKEQVEALFHSLTLVAAMLLVTGTLLFVSERLRRGGRREAELSWRDALLAGLAQACAIVPGISRSGSTIAVLLCKGVDGETAARFSFLLALPAVFGAGLLSLPGLQQVPAGQLSHYFAGMAAAFVSGLASIHLLLAVIRRRRLFAFALYCWAVGGLFLGLNL